MNTTEKLILIAGEFSSEDAREILQSVFSEKIKFHVHRNLSSIERFGKEDDIALERIPELKKEMQRIKEIFNGAEEHHNRLKLSCEVKISFL